MNSFRLRACLGSFIILFSSLSLICHAQETIYNPEHSAARNWNEALLFAIRKDFARPTVHARNLYHTSAMMYDLWSVFDQQASPIFIGDRTGLDACAFDTTQKDSFISNNSDLQSSRETAISYAMYRLLSHRFSLPPAVVRAQTEFVEMANFYQVDREFTSTDLDDNNPAALGNYIAQCLIEYGLQDGSNEADLYANSFYEPVNLPLEPALPGNPNMADSDRWQPLKLDVFIDQAGNETDTPPFLGAEWGEVLPFALTENDLSINERDGQQFYVYHDPGFPAYLRGDDAKPAEYQWGHALVALWSSHLDPADGVVWDISPASIGNTSDLPEDIEGLRDFYQGMQGGSTDTGYTINPATQAPYESQMVPRGDYVRVLAEFWADGPDSETPPGHWFTILNEAVSDHPDFTRQYAGQGEAVSELEWDVKAYLVLGGAVHDSAITAWGIKGWYDYVRPISAIRHMAEFGQSTDPALPNYHQDGLPLTQGFIELVEAGDVLAGENSEHVGKVKLYAWRGPDAVNDPETDTAGVSWILAENWWPYQRPSFVTPPFAGYVSGHSTFSRAASEVLTLLTGDEYFPGGMGEFIAERNNFLVFEQGPSVDIKLQWAKFKDASDQTSLSRIWGGIHPPVDDVPGRRIGIQIGQNAFALAEQYFTGQLQTLPTPEPEPPTTPTPTSPQPSSEGGGSIGYVLLFICLVMCARLKRIKAHCY